MSKSERIIHNATSLLAAVFALAPVAAQQALHAQGPAPITWTETQLSDDPADQFEAVVRDGKVAWVDYGSGNSDIHVYDLATGQLRPITTDPADQFNPRLDGDWVAYGDSRNDLGDIYAFNLVTGVETLLSTDPGLQADPAISGDRVIWSDISPAYDIYGRSLLGGPIFYVVIGPRPEFNPRIAGDLVVWEELNVGAGLWDIRVLDLATLENRLVAAGPEYEREPDIDGTRIVYLKFHSDNVNADVFLYDFASGLTTQLTTTPAARRRPRISGDTVVWYEGPSGAWDVRGYDLITSTELPLAVGTSSSLLPEIDGHDVVFSDDRNGNWDIYRLTLNRDPEAAAGPDQEVEATSPEGALVTLDGSASSDPDGDALSFTWTGPFGTLSGAVVSAPVPLGTSEITLTIEDGWGGSASDTLVVTVHDTPGCAPAYIETFDPHGPDADPAGWVDFARQGHGWVEREGFRTARWGETIVYRSERAQRASEYRTPEALAWRDYEWSGLFRLPARVGNGFLFYADLVAERYYQIRFTPNFDGHSGYRLLKAGSQPLDGRTLSGFVPRPGVWYRIRVRVDNEAEWTRIRARFWAPDRVEASDWMIDARDVADPLRAGAIGITALAPGVLFDDFRVQALCGAASGVSGDRDGDGACDGKDVQPDVPR